MAGARFLPDDGLSFAVVMVSASESGRCLEAVGVHVIDLDVVDEGAFDEGLPCKDCACVDVEASVEPLACAAMLSSSTQSPSGRDTCSLRLYLRRNARAPSIPELSFSNFNTNSVARMTMLASFAFAMMSNATLTLSIVSLCS